MQIKARLKRVEAELKIRHGEDYETLVIVEPIPGKKGLFRVLRRGRQSYEGNLEEVEAFLKPYYEAGSMVIWDDIVQD